MEGIRIVNTKTFEVTHVATAYDPWIGEADALTAYVPYKDAWYVIGGHWGEDRDSIYYVAYSAPCEPTAAPLFCLTSTPTGIPTNGPTSNPIPTSGPTSNPTSAPTGIPTNGPTSNPTSAPTGIPTNGPTSNPTSATYAPTRIPTNPTSAPTRIPTNGPTSVPTRIPTNPTSAPTPSPTMRPTVAILSTFCEDAMEHTLMDMNLVRTAMGFVV
eukprot:503571_1